MRIAHFIQRYPPALGGAEAYFARLGRYLATRGHDVSVFTSNALDLEAFWSPAGRTLEAGTTNEDGVAIKRYPLWRCRGRRWLLKPLSFLPQRTWQCLTLPCNPISLAMWQEAGRPQERFDLVHASAFPYAFPMACGLRLARSLGVPFLATPFLHLGDPANPRDRTRAGYTSPPLVHLLKNATRVFAQTEWERDFLGPLGVPAERVVLQGMGVDPAECTGGVRTFARQGWQCAEEEVVVGMLANHSAEKGTLDLLRAAELLWHKGRRFCLVLAGPEMPNFRRFWPGYGCQQRVVRLGVIDDEQKRDFFAGIDLFALPSRSDSFGLVLLEAWANGVPCLGYRAGGVGEVIHHEEDGLLARCGAIDELAGCLDQLIASAALRRRLGDTGKERVQRNLRWHDKLALVERVYLEAADQPALKPSGVSSTK
ncbi:MAG: glycosyltransferase family 4 protein [Gemmataceae bacterium]